jgi:hypothetical protein
VPSLAASPRERHRHGPLDDDRIVHPDDDDLDDDIDEDEDDDLDEDDEDDESAWGDEEPDGPEWQVDAGRLVGRAPRVH